MAEPEKTLEGMSKHLDDILERFQTLYDAANGINPASLYRMQYIIEDLKARLNYYKGLFDVYRDSIPSPEVSVEDFKRLAKEAAAFVASEEGQRLVRERLEEARKVTESQQPKQFTMDERLGLHHPDR